MKPITRIKGINSVFQSAKFTWIKYGCQSRFNGNLVISVGADLDLTGGWH